LNEAVPGAAFVEASCFSEARERLEQQTFSAAFFDVDADEIGGPASLQMIRADHPELILGVVSRFDQSGLILSYLAAGVNGYIVECSSRSEIERAVETLFQGAIYAPPSLAKLQTGKCSNGHESSHSCRSAMGLTRRQREVLELVREGRSDKEIAKELGLSPHTIKIHVGSLLRHFSARRRTDLPIVECATHENARHSARMPRMLLGSVDYA
jgi:DNA-binding NarL/FixJ family response regulator